MKNLKILAKMAGGHALSDEDDGPARRTQIVVMAAAASAVLCAVYGFAAGGTELSYSFANLYKLPMVVLLASMGSVPAALVAWNLIGSSQRASDLGLGIASGTLSGALVLAVLSPLVALYYHTSAWLGPFLALGAAGAALFVGTLIMFRTVLVRAPKGESRFKRWMPVSVMFVAHFLTIAQLISVSDIMVENTFLDRGLEGLGDSEVARRNDP
jgi:hypothetical protein